MSELSAASVAALTDYMFIPDSVLRADCTIVLGMTLFHRPVARAIELQAQGLAGRVIFSGGYNPRLQSCEAHEMQKAWRRLGQTDDVLDIEAFSTNTRENMTHVKSLLENKGWLTDTHTVNLIAISYHMRRAVETFHDVFGQALTLGTASYPSQHCPPQGWADQQKGRDLVVSEFLKIQKYLPHRLPPEASSLARALAAQTLPSQSESMAPPAVCKN